MDKKDKKEKDKSALQVNEGIEQPDSLNKEAINRFRKRKRQQFSIQEYVDGILSDNRTVLGRAITMIESSLPEHRYC